jgi:hypothetical protein
MLWTFLLRPTLSFVGVLLWVDTQGMAMKRGGFVNHPETNSNNSLYGWNQCEFSHELSQCMAAQDKTTPDSRLWNMYDLYIYYD